MRNLTVRHETPATLAYLGEKTTKAVTITNGEPGDDFIEINVAGSTIELYSAGLADRTVYFRDDLLNGELVRVTLD